MNFKTKIALAFILTILLSCSSETNDDIASIDNEIYLNGSRTVRTANDYHALIGKYDLNHITN